MQTDTIPSGTSTKYFWFFLAVFGLRYIRVISNIIGNVVYRPSCVAWKPKYDASDVTVMIPTMGLNSELLHQVVKSILLHPIAKLIIVTNGPDFEDNCSSFRDVIADPRISHLDCENKGRRHKTALALPHVHTPLVILQDNKSTWPKSPSFIPLMIAPFEDSQMGAVTPAIKAQHHHHRNIIKAFYNFLGMTYLVRRCHEYKACNAIDGGLSTLPGRFGLFRTSIYASKEFQQAYLNEYCWVPFYGLRGPLDADDDKFHTRWLIEHGWKMKIQALPETTLMTENGELDRFYNQVLRWTRTTWRSNPKELSHAKVWRRHPFTSITLLLWMVRMSLIYEVLLFWLLYKSCQGKSSAGKSQGFAVEAGLLALWIVALKFNKISPHFVRHPKDLVFFAPYILFGWYCSLVKIWAGLTCWNISWEVAKPAATNEHTEGTKVSDNAKDAETSSVDWRYLSDGMENVSSYVSKERECLTSL